MKTGKKDGDAHPFYSQTKKTELIPIELNHSKQFKQLIFINRRYVLALSMRDSEEILCVTPYTVEHSTDDIGLVADSCC